MYIRLAIILCLNELMRAERERGQPVIVITNLDSLLLVFSALVHNTRTECEFVLKSKNHQNQEKVLSVFFSTPSSALRLMSFSFPPEGDRERLFSLSQVHAAIGCLIVKSNKQMLTYYPDQNLGLV